MNTNLKIGKNKGFTLIELLIVIGLLGALTALVLPSLSADREEAMGDVCDYNQAGTVRTLKQFHQLTGMYPNDMHTGLRGTDAAALAMEGLPSAQKDHMIAATPTGPCPSRHQLTDAHVASLKAAGITRVCSGTGLNSTAVANTVHVVHANNGSPWNDDSAPPQEMTFDGRSLTEWSGKEDVNGNGTVETDEGTGDIIVLWIAPTTDWANKAGANKDWGNGAVELGIDMEGQCPIPAEAASGEEVAFAYYMAYFKVYNDGTPAKLIGTTCPECGVLNP